MIITDATSLPRLIACIGSRRLVETVGSRRTASPTRDEGDAVHWAIEHTIKSGGVPPSENTKAPNGTPLTAEMIDHATEYLAAVRTPASRFEIDTSFASDHWRVNGRADHIAYVGGCLYVDDFKYGWRIVEPERNWTLIFHAASWCISSNNVPQFIQLRIHQPRPYHPDGPVRTWQIDHAQLMALWCEIVEALTDHSDNLTTGPQCHNCPALATCPAARKAALNAVDLTERYHSEELDDAALSRELDLIARAIKLLEDRHGALENLAQYRISQGAVVENYALEQGLSNARWKDGLTPEILLAITGQNVAQSKLVTPAEAKRRGVSPEAINALTERVPTKLKLVRIDADKRARRLLKPKA